MASGLQQPIFRTTAATPSSLNTTGQVRLSFPTSFTKPNSPILSTIFFPQIKTQKKTRKIRNKYLSWTEMEWSSGGTSSRGSQFCCAENDDNENRCSGPFGRSCLSKKLGGKGHGELSHNAQQQRSSVKSNRKKNKQQKNTAT